MGALELWGPNSFKINEFCHVLEYFFCGGQNRRKLPPGGALGTKLPQNLRVSLRPGPRFCRCGVQRSVTGSQNLNRFAVWGSRTRHRAPKPEPFCVFGYL